MAELKEILDEQTQAHLEITNVSSETPSKFKLNNVLPDSKCEIINLEKEKEDVFVLKAFEKQNLTEKDIEFLVEYLLSPFTWYSEIDISACSDPIKQQIISTVLSRNDEENGFLDTFWKMGLYKYDFPGVEFLVPWAVKVRQNRFDLMDVDKEYHKKIFEGLVNEIKTIFQKEIADIFLNKLTAECNALMERDISLHESPLKVLEHLTYVAIIVFQKFGPFVPEIKKEEYKLLERLLLECFSISDRDLRYRALRLFSQMLLKKERVSFSSLAAGKSRFHIAALAISSFATKPEFIKEISSLAFYRQGIYNRILTESLIRLALDKTISSQSKLDLFGKILKHIKGNPDKNFHYGIWTLLITILQSNVSDQIEKILKNFSDQNFLEDIFWQILHKALNIPETERKLYLEHFNNPLHHLFFGYRQNMIQKGLNGEWGYEERNKFDHFLVTMIQKGADGYRQLRYNESINPHLACMFSGEKGKKFKSEWSAIFSPVSLIEESFLKGCTLCCSDDPWDLFTWAMGINCLEPMWGRLYIVAHLLNGQNKVILLKDPSNKVIGGYIFHLMLLDPHKPTPILAVGKSYIREGYDIAQKHAIQRSLDKMAIKVAKNLDLPLVAILTSMSDQNMHRTIEKVKDPQGIFMKPGFVGNDTDQGIDYDWYPSDTRKEVAGNKRVIFDYQFLFNPTPFLTLEGEKKSEKEKDILQKEEPEEASLLLQFERVKNESLDKTSIRVDDSKERPNLSAHNAHK